MSHREPEPVLRHCDVAVVGGSAAGLAAALSLVRHRRSVIVVDDGAPRNAPAAHLHGYLGGDGAAPGALLAAGREEVRGYGGEILRAHVTAVTRTPDERFRLEIDGGHGIVARRVIVATGITDGTKPDDHVTAVEPADGTRLDADVVMVGTRFRPRVEVFATVGLVPTPHPTGLGDTIWVDPSGATSVPGVYATGNVTDPGQQVLAAAADGRRVGAMVASSLAHEDVRAASRPSGIETDWDQRYSGDDVWSGNPNGTLVNEVSGMAPGRALDVGAGEGGDALWLAEQGWRVTASDVSGRALDRVRAAAGRRGLAVDCLHTDANALDAFPAEAFDLVSASYASFPRTPDARGLENMLRAVAPGGTLLVVGHDLTPLRELRGAAAHAMMFDPDAMVQVDDVAAALAGSAEWTVEVHETRPRPAGAVSTGHVDDVVLRARRIKPAG